MTEIALVVLCVGMLMIVLSVERSNVTQVAGGRVSVTTRLEAFLDCCTEVARRPRLPGAMEYPPAGTVVSD